MKFLVICHLQPCKMLIYGPIFKIRRSRSMVFGSGRRLKPFSEAYLESLQKYGKPRRKNMKFMRKWKIATPQLKNHFRGVVDKCNCVYYTKIQLFGLAPL